MKRILPIIFTIFFIIPETDACNVCGCGVSNYHYGILPQFHKNFAGIRYRYRSYRSHLDAVHQAAFSDESFQSTELWGRFYPAKRLQAFIFVPFNFNERIEGEKTTKLSGLGDIVLSANYNLFNTYDSTAVVKHTLLVGAGVKLPTGQFRAIEDGLTINQNFQLGTGSTDFLFNVIYTARIARLGFNAEFTYNVNTINRDDYQFGNTSRSGVTAFYVLNAGSVTVMPNAGLSLETFNDNKKYGQTFDDTGGWATLLNAGLESYYRSVAVGINYTEPGKQNLFNGKVNSNSRISMHLTFMF